jgi:hypothetical protein
MLLKVSNWFLTRSIKVNHTLPLITILYFAQAIDWERYAAVAGRFLPFLVFGTSVLGFMLHKYIGIQVRATHELKRRVQGAYLLRKLLTEDTTR